MAEAIALTSFLLKFITHDSILDAQPAVNYTPLKWGACPKTSTRTLVKRMRVGISHDVLYLNLRRYGRLAAGLPAVEVI
jgi:hypothetical protein